MNHARGDESACPRARQRRVTVAVALALLPHPGCQEQTPRAVRDRSRLTLDVTVRDVRVLIAENTPEVTIRIDGPYAVRSPASGTLVKSSGLARTVLTAAEGEFAIGDRRWPEASLEVVPGEGAHLWLARRSTDGGSALTPYAGWIRCLRSSPTCMDVINVVDIETYVTGVIACELYAKFNPETFRTQSVAARTYALYQMAQSADREYDVRATEASQVYGGLPTGLAARKARDAVQYTRGIVCTWTSDRGERIFCTYYSAACGGLSQDVTDALRRESVPPLAGGVRCDYCRIAPPNVYRWGPVSLSKRNLADALVARFPALASLGRIEDVVVSERTRQGRPRRIRLTGATGQVHELAANDFRLAVGSRIMRSTDCRIVTGRDDVQFLDGRGFGHGVGLCQWGAEGQARLGRRAGQILKFYYPGAHLTRLY